ncbi:hypothetical protein [Nocardioides montaniterrae]
MVATRSARERKARAEAGPLAHVSIAVAQDDQFRYTIRCRECADDAGAAWTSWRRGEDNGYLAVMDRWILHLVDRHAGAVAPCLAYADSARARRGERRGS